jgi:hypothetical protein
MYVLYFFSNEQNEGPFNLINDMNGTLWARRGGRVFCYAASFLCAHDTRSLWLVINDRWGMESTA